MRRALRLALCAAAAAIGCGDRGSTPARVVASAGGAGYWPADSRTAVLGSIEAGFDGIELDIGMTRDHSPLLAPDPWFDPERCARPGGDALPEPLLIRRMDVERVREQIVCGGIPDPAFDQAEVVAEPPMLLTGLAAALHDAPGAMVVQLDVKQRTPLTAPAEVFAREVLERWFAEDLPQRLEIASADPALLLAFDAEARTLGVDVPSWRVFPDPDDGVNDAAGVEGDRLVGGIDYVLLAEEARATGLLLRWDLLDPRLARAARREGLAIGAWTVDAPAELRRLVLGGEVDVVLTSFPGDAP